jgi:hypothetical protein
MKILFKPSTTRIEAILNLTARKTKISVYYFEYSNVLYILLSYHKLMSD